MKLNESNIVIVVGDLGSGVNLVKNILLTSPDVDWPYLESDRFNFLVKTSYPESLKSDMSQWVILESKVRLWGQLYGADIADEYQDINTSTIIARSQTHRLVFISHWCNIALELKKQYPGIKIISLYPENFSELLWQVKTYIDKRGIDKIGNFSFADNIEQSKKNYIEQHGIDTYYKFNISNMVGIFNDRASQYKTLSNYTISIGELASPTWVQRIAQQLNIKIDQLQATKLIDIWKNLHEPDDAIDTCPWLELVRQENYDNKLY